MSWSLPSHRTKGLSMNVLTPWETGPVPATAVAFRYAGLEAGDRVTDAVARTKRRASTCWAGTDARELTLKLRVVPISTMFFGQGPYRMLRAYTSVTQDWLDPMMPASRGRVGTRDVNYCS